MNGGSPPTAPKARAGLLTPPGMTRLARTKASWLAGRRKSGLDRAGVVIVGAFAFPISRFSRSSDQASVDQFVPAFRIEDAIAQVLESDEVGDCLDLGLDGSLRRPEPLATLAQQNPFGFLDSFLQLFLQLFLRARLPGKSLNLSSSELLEGEPSQYSPDKPNPSERMWRPKGPRSRCGSASVSNRSSIRLITAGNSVDETREIGASGKVAMFPARISSTGRSQTRTILYRK